MSCSVRPNGACWTGCRCCAADSTLRWPNGSAAAEPLAPQAIAGLLASLAGKSLVQVQAGPVIRYSLLETVRQFAAGRLAASGEETAVHARLLRWALEVARSAEAALPGAEWPGWSGQLSADQANIRAALSWALGGAEPEAGRELAARLARWWIATGRYSDAGQFLTTAAGVPAAAAPGIQARVLLGTAWSAYHLGDSPRAAPLAADGIACARQAGEPQLEALGPQPAGRPGLARGRRGADRRRNRSQQRPIRPGRSGARGAGQVLLANAAFLAGDLAEQERHGLLAAELARTAAGQEGLALALTVSVDRRDRRSRHPGPPPWPPSTRPRTVTGGASGPLHRDGHAPLAGAAVRHPGPARSGRNGARVVLGRGTKRRRPAGGIPRPAGRGPHCRRPGRHRGRRRRAPPGRRRRAPRRDRHARSRHPGPPGMPGRHRR